MTLEEFQQESKKRKVGRGKRSKPDGTGLCILMKRLERGNFASLWDRTDGSGLRLTPSELSIFLEGSKVVGKIHLILPDLEKDSLAVSRDL